MVGTERFPTAVVETHISTLFFVGDRVYKLHKPVRFGFLDFTGEKERRADCQREVQLNRRLAPDIYLGVAALTMDHAVIDHLVVMRRLPAARRLATLAKEGIELDRWTQLVAAALVEFHHGAERSPEISADATGEAIQTIWQQAFDEAEPFVGSVLDGADEAEIRRLARRWIEGRGPLLDQRIAAGHICDGHGDLQAEDVFCLEDGVRILDCLEFSDRLRHGDVCADVAFLAMDLERLGREEAARMFLRFYQERAGDQLPASLVDHYWASRAYTRSMVSCLRSTQGDEEAQAQARQLQSMALEHLRTARVRLILVGGLPGSGKSTVASGVGEGTGWTVLRSDDLRRELFGGEAEGGWDGVPPPYLTGRYRPEATRAVYQELLRRAERLLGLGRSVILDASWTDASLRQTVSSVADRTSSDLSELCCACGSEEAEAHILKRRADASNGSEATPAVRRAMRMDPWPTAVEIDSTAISPEAAVRMALAELSLEPTPVALNGDRKGPGPSGWAPLPPPSGAPHASLEQELKFDVATDFVPPDFPGRLGRWERLAIQHLDTVYYDTPDCRLWRSGITFRFRSGEEEGHGVWTMKLPVNSVGPTVDRTELSWSGIEAAVPAEASCLLVGVVRSFPLGPLVRLHSTRSRTALTGPTGDRLGELDDDSVVIGGGDRNGTRFRQIEFELAADHGETVEQITELFQAPGAHSSSEQKLAKAVSLPTPYGRHSAQIDDPPNIRALAKHACAQAFSHLIVADLSMREDPQDPAVEAVHHARVATRRLRSDLKLLMPALDHEWVKTLRVELKWFGGVLGRVRDDDVLAGVFDVESDGSPLDAEGRKELHERLALQRLDQCGSLQTAMSSERYRRLLDLLDRTAEQGPPEPTQSRSSTSPAPTVATMLAQLVHKRQKKLRRAVSHAGRQPNDLQMHGLRIQAKELRYAAEMASSVLGAPARKTAELTVMVQDVLGEYHDTVTAEAWLQEQATQGSAAASYASGGMAAGQRQARDHLRLRWQVVWRHVNRSLTSIRWGGEA